MPIATFKWLALLASLGRLRSAVSTTMSLRWSWGAMCRCLALIVLLNFETALPASAVEGRFSDQALQTFAQADKTFQSQPENPKAAWEFARACFDLADFATNGTERAELAERGIAACRGVLSKDSKSAPGHYYLGLNLGQLARTRSLGALRLVKQMEKEFSAAVQLDARLDYAGPDRSLGLLYLDAPSFGSIGSRSKAKLHLQRAVELAPDYPDNRLSLLEAFLKWGDRDDARHELQVLEELWPKAHSAFSGPKWNVSWADWENRLAQAKKKLAEM